MRHLAAASQTYRLYNNCRGTAFQVLTGQATVGGANDATQYVFRRDDNASRSVGAPHRRRVRRANVRPNADAR